MACDWTTMWGSDAAALKGLLDAQFAQHGKEWGKNLETTEQFQALLQLQATLIYALDADATTDVEWVGGSIDGAAIKAKAEAVVAGLHTMLGDPDCGDSGDAGWLNQSSESPPAADAADDLYRGVKDTLDIG